MGRKRWKEPGGSLAGLGGVLLEKPHLQIEMIERVVRVRDRNGRVVPLRANAAQRRFEERRGRENVVLKARQMGITTWVAARFFLRTITRPGTTTLLVAHTREASESIFAMVRRMWEGLPEDVREGALRPRRHNLGELVFAEIGSEFRVASAADPNAGRGLSVQNLHCSEVSRWPGNAAETLAGLRAALAPGGELVLESTPCGAYGAFYEEWKSGVEPTDGRVLADETQRRDEGMVRHFLPWWLEPAYVGPAVRAETMTAEEAGLMERHGLRAEQLGFRRGLERRYGALRSQEFAEDAETCFRATGSCCFETEILERRLAEVAGPRWTERGGALCGWLPPVPGRQYVVAVDSAGGGAEGDFAAVQVVELETGLQCAELKERLTPAELARVSAELARRYEGALLAVERNNHGAAVLAFLETQQRYGHVYLQGGQAGWLTSAASKPEMVARLGVLLGQTPERFLSRRLLGECRTFVTDERGRAAAAAGAHDDLVMAMAIAQAVRAEMLESR
jgi:hypothetical protein